MKKKENRGITLIALVITIIVLLILAGVSIATLTGQNGILTQANNAKTQTTQSKAEELVTLAIGTLQSENLGDTSKITPEEIANQINEDNNRTDVVAEGTSFPTNINFVNDGVKVHVNVDMTIGEETNNDYEVAVDESEIAPKELFNIEIVEGKQASTDGNVSTTGYAKITGIKKEYCNKAGYKAEDGTVYEDTNYGIKYNENGFEIKDKLIIPAYIEEDGVKYPVKEVSLTVYPSDKYILAINLPSIDTIIYPNTVQSLITTKVSSTSGNECVQVILPKNIKEIPDCLFSACNKLNNITIPASVTSIGEKAFHLCKELTNIKIPSNVTTIGECAFDGCKSLGNITIPSNVTTIEKNTFRNCEALTNITIPSNVTDIGESAFDGCKSLEQITIPSKVTEIKYGTFMGCSDLTNITMPESVNSIGMNAFLWSGIEEINIEGKTEGEITGEPWGATGATINWLGEQ